MYLNEHFLVQSMQRLSIYSILFIVIIIAVLLVPRLVAGSKQLLLTAPGDHVREDQIKVYSDKVVLDMQDTIYARFEGTGSMKPFLDKGSHALQYKPTSTTDIAIGDIITYTKDSTTIVHRVAATGTDEKGSFYLVKGDNNDNLDPIKLRFNDINSVVYAIIY